jgi:GTPase
MRALQGAKRLDKMLVSVYALSNLQGQGKNTMFFDEAKIFVQGGQGGNGCVSFRREKFEPLGGPNGGNGGRGASVCLVADPNVNTLIDFKKRSHFKAERGEHGRGKSQYGKSGKDWIVPVPLGTVARDFETGQLLADLAYPGQTVVVAQGGRGGRGNETFKSSTNQAPRIAERGEPGEERWITLELKLIADVGLVGMPNAGKSTLLASISAAHPKIADYPFTTLEPNLGVVAVDDDSFVVADIPGLIEGAHQGSGLGHKFLRHIERNRMLIHVLDGLSTNPVNDYDQIRQELALFDRKLSEKPEVVVLNKMDLPDVQARWPEVRTAFSLRNLELLEISAVTGQGTMVLLRKIAALLKSLPVDTASTEGLAVFEGPTSEDHFEIVRKGEAWHVTGPRIDRLVAMTNFDYGEAIERFQRILEAMGVLGELRKMGVKSGDTVIIADIEMEWEW